jgi:hypothetical protein
MRIIKQGIVSGKTDSFFSYCAWPSACVDENGVIYVVCSGNRMGHLCPFGKILMFRSFDGGLTFTPPSITADRFLDNRDPGILYLGGGRMLVTDCSHPAVNYETEYNDWIYSDSGTAGTGLVKHYSGLGEADRAGGCFYRILENYGNTVGEDRRIPVHCPHGPIMLSDGTVFYLGKEAFSPCPERKDRFSVYISENSGETFEKAAECPVPDGYNTDTFHEAHCAELADGRIMALFRSHLTEDDSYFTVMKTFTSDRGKTWSEWEKTGICGSPPHICKTASGAFALTYGRRIEPYGIYARIVDSDGNIGDEEIKLASCRDSDIGYPCTVLLPDKTLFTVYYARYKSDTYASLLYTIWSEE